MKQVQQTGLRMIKINENNKLPIKCNKKYTTHSGFMKIDDKDMNKIIEEVYMGDKFDIQFDICVGSKCEYDDYSRNNEEESSNEEDDRF